MLICLALAELGSSVAYASDDPTFAFSARPGPYAVGLRVVEQYDASRTYLRATDNLGKPYQGGRARPLQTLVWYPAEHNSGKPMTVGEYGELWATEVTFGHPNMPDRAKEWLDSASRTLTTPLWAVRDALPVAGRFPVVIYAPGANGQSWENVDLCEYLASHGYVVIATPDMGEKNRQMTLDLEGVNAQARDISFLIGYAGTLPNTNMAAVAAVGYSWGGISNLFAAARDNRINALVSLDGSMRYYPGLVKRAGDVRPEEMSIPLLAFVQLYWSLEDETHYVKEEDRNGPNVLNEWAHGDLIHVHMLGLSHTGFCSMAQRSEDWWWNLFHQWPMLQADYGRVDAMTGYEWMARYTLQFLDAYLMHDSAALAFLRRTPAENGVPPHTMVVAYRPSTGTSASFDGFRAAVGSQGFNNAGDIYAALRRQKSDFELDEVSVNSWAESLIEENHVPEAIDLLALNLETHPDSGPTYAILGDAYRRSGQKQSAIDSYKLSLEKDPLNAAARNRKLAELQDSKTDR